jgi:hypothetical protein
VASSATAVLAEQFSIPLKAAVGKATAVACGDSCFTACLEEAKTVRCRGALKIEEKKEEAIFHEQVGFKQI